MASTGAKAALMDTSLKRLASVMPKISKAAGVEPVAIPEYDRDPELLAAYRLEALANWAERLLEHFEPSKQTTKADTDEQAADMPDAQTDETPKERAQDKKKGK